METWILMVALLFQSTLRPQAGMAATQAEFGNREACEFALQKVQTEWGKDLGVGGVYAVCVPSGFKRGEARMESDRSSQACREDTQRFCSSVQQGGVTDCLIDHHKDISEDCYRQALKSKLGSQR